MLIKQNLTRLFTSRNLRMSQVATANCRKLVLPNVVQEEESFACSVGSWKHRILVKFGAIIKGDSLNFFNSYRKSWSFKPPPPEAGVAPSVPAGQEETAAGRGVGYPAEPSPAAATRGARQPALPSPSSL